MYRLVYYSLLHDTVAMVKVSLIRQMIQLGIDKFMPGPKHKDCFRALDNPWIKITDMTILFIAKFLSCCNHSAAGCPSQRNCALCSKGMNTQIYWKGDLLDFIKQAVRASLCNLTGKYALGGYLIGQQGDALAQIQSRLDSGLDESGEAGDGRDPEMDKQGQENLKGIFYGNRQATTRGAVLESESMTGPEPVPNIKQQYLQPQQQLAEKKKASTIPGRVPSGALPAWREWTRYQHTASEGDTHGDLDWFIQEKLDSSPCKCVSRKFAQPLCFYSFLGIIRKGLVE